MIAAILSSTPLTLSSTALVTFRTCAVAILVSSCVSLSSLFSASSISVFPITFFRYFSESRSVNGNTIIHQKLTRPSLSDLFSCNSKDVEDLDHYFRDNIHHFLVECRSGVDLESLEECLYTLEDLKKSVLARTSFLGCLRAISITMDQTRMLRKVHTKRRTPIPTKIVFAGENTYNKIISMRIHVKGTSLL